jgi:hypothetical protein
MDYLIFLPSVDAALSRRARKHSTLSAVVLQWSRARKRYERQGLLVEEDALQRVEKECLIDEEIRVRRREREAERRAELDQGYVMRFTARVRELSPNCPAGREQVSGRREPLITRRSTVLKLLPFWRLSLVRELFVHAKGAG